VEGSDFSYVEEIYEYYIFCGLVKTMSANDCDGWQYGNKAVVDLVGYLSGEH
jgi:hypothetical protein